MHALYSGYSALLVTVLTATTEQTLGYVKTNAELYLLYHGGFKATAHAGF